MIESQLRAKNNLLVLHMPVFGMKIGTSPLPTFMKSWTAKGSENCPNATIASVLIALTYGWSPTLLAHFVEIRSVL